MSSVDREAEISSHVDGVGTVATMAPSGLAGGTERSLSDCAMNRPALGIGATGTRGERETNGIGTARTKGDNRGGHDVST